MEQINERILSELRTRNIKLWQPPYYYYDTHSSTTSSSRSTKSGKNEAALSKLASIWSVNLKMEQGDILKALDYFQNKALDKLKAKQKKIEKKKKNKVGTNFIIKILGLHQINNDDEEKKNKVIYVSTNVWNSLSFSKAWAENVEVKHEPLLSSSSSFSDGSTTSTSTTTLSPGPMVLTLALQTISPTLTLTTFLTELKKELEINEHCVARMIYQGVNLLQPPATTSSEEEDIPLYELVASCPSASHGTGGSGSGGGGPTILCLLSPPPPPPTLSLETAPPQETNDQIIIASIQKAASRITKTTNFDITDQNGTIVSMTTQDRLRFLMTLGLHKLGQKRLYGSENEKGSEEEEDGGGDTDRVASALTFLLQADAEWNNTSPSASSSSSTSASSSSSTTTTTHNEEWKTKADNYGLLQLDIAWSYLKLSSIQHLPDALHRLEIAETVLRKQVHSNFVTLALVQADLEHGVVPPLAAVFVRLFLLQGVGYLHSSAATTSVENGDERRKLEEKASERLNWSFLLCQKLRAASSPSSVLELQTVIPDLTLQDATCALRKCNGNANAAVELIEQERLSKQIESRKRSMQKRIGLCENGMDYVNLGLVSQLGSMLGLQTSGEGKGQRRLGDYENAHYGSYTESCITMSPGCRKNEKIVESLLRLSNNDVGRAVDLYQNVQMDGDEILRRVSKLDKDSDSNYGQSNRKRSWDTLEEEKENDGGAIEDDDNKMEEEMNVKIDDMALATLESMGVEESMAKMALRKTKNDVDASLFWLTDHQSKEKQRKDAEDAVSTSGSSSPPSSLSDEKDFGSCGDTKPPYKASKKNAGMNDKNKKSPATADGLTDNDELFQKKKDEEEKEKLRLQKEEEDWLRREREEEERQRREKEEEEAFQILQEALEHHGGGGGHDTMGYYIGSDLDEEWSLLQKYRRHL